MGLVITRKMHDSIILEERSTKKRLEIIVLRGKDRGNKTVRLLFNGNKEDWSIQRAEKTTSCPDQNPKSKKKS